ncbi:MAG: hypothetical protein P8L30_01020 [Longimicrobiales bacterium]|nr:hypothetical protein [Longimicrobiales bacterium]
MAESKMHIWLDRLLTDMDAEMRLQGVTPQSRRLYAAHVRCSPMEEEAAGGGSFDQNLGFLRRWGTREGLY